MAASLCVTVLAAGKGTRMRNALPKVLHPLAGRTLLEHVLVTAAELTPDRAVLVLGPEMEVAVVAGRSPLAPAIVVQEPQLGTGHALMVARGALPASGMVLVLFGDTPLLTGTTLARLIAARAEANAAVAVLGMRPADPTGYGRLRLEGGHLVEIIEDQHADQALKRVGLCNAGVMAFDAARLGALLDALPPRPETGEHYLTDAVAAAVARGWSCVAIEGPAEEGIGVNSQTQLAEAAAILQRRLRERLLEAGVIMPAPDTVQLCADTEIGPGTLVEPYVVFGPAVRVGAEAVIHSFCHLERATVADRAEIGPFARLRPGSDIGEGAKLGNFVETKNTRLEPGAKANHLSYLGDTTVGARATSGPARSPATMMASASTRRGSEPMPSSDRTPRWWRRSRSARAPSSAAGSVITRDVPDDGLAVARAHQTTHPDRAERLREQLRRRKNG